VTDTPATDWVRPVVHLEIQGKDGDRLRAFYEAMFNWPMTPGPVPIMTNFPAGIGGPEPGPAGHIMSSDAPRVVLYVQVADLPASMRQAEELGGAVVSQRLDIPGGASVARIADPEGNHIVIVQQ